LEDEKRREKEKRKKEKRKTNVTIRRNKREVLYRKTINN